MPTLFPVSVPVPPAVTRIRGVPSPEIFTDGSRLYGAVVSEPDDSVTVLWRLSHDASLDGQVLAAAFVPSSLHAESPLHDVLEEAVSSGAWD